MHKKILVTGAAGYIGSHTCVELLENGYEVVAIDNLSNSSETALKRVEEITGKKVHFEKFDLLERDRLEDFFERHPIEAVIHFAGCKAAGESVEKPLKYYANNFAATLNLLEVMGGHDVKNIVFSSSATVYGDPDTVPITETFPTKPINPYGRSKLFVEDMLKDLHHSDSTWNAALLRYFNPIGAHSSGKIGEDPNDIPNNLLPFVAQVAIGKREKLQVFGDDYPTPDGTGVRDYIHVMDLAHGHIKALEKLTARPGVVTYNLGTGNGYSVLEVITAFEKASGKNIPGHIAPRRPGDSATCYANASKARDELGWHAKKGLDEMCEDIWRWQVGNPEGF